MVSASVLLVSKYNINENIIRKMILASYGLWTANLLLIGKSNMNFNILSITKTLTLSGVSNERRDPTAMTTTIVRTW